MSLLTDRQQPCSIEAEQSVLGGLMLAPDAFWSVAEILTPDDFFRRDHGLIWRAIKESVDESRPYDAVTLGDWFEAHGLAEQVAGGAYLTELAMTTASAANIVAYAEIVADKAKRRRLIEVGTRIVNDGFAAGDRTTDQLVGDAQSAVGSVGESRRTVLKSVGDGMREMVEAMQRRMEGGGMAGTSFGLPALDEMTGGKRGGDLIIIAGRPSMGKTTLALQGGMAAGRPLIFSFETKADNLLARMTAHVGRLPLAWILNPQTAPDHAFRLIVAASREVKERLSASIYDGRRLSFDQLRAIAIREHSKSPVSEIIVDHLGHMKLAGKGRADQEMGEITKGAKELSRELDVPVILLMQLNRGVESRADKRPMLSDLRECGAAEEDADVVAMVYRDAYYNPTGALRSFGEIFLRKNRDGEAGEIWTKPVLPEMRFDPAEPQERPTGNAGTSGGYGGGSPGIRSRSKQGEVSAYV